MKKPSWPRGFAAPTTSTYTRCAASAVGAAAGRTELVFHLRGSAGKPGDRFVYDGWDEALTNFERHLAGEQG